MTVKDGGIIGVRVLHAGRHGGAMIATGDNAYSIVEPSAVCPIPPDPHQALKDAVIAAAGEVRITHPLTDERLRAIIKMFDALDALTAAQTPPKPDPVEVFYEAVDRQHLCDNVFHPSHRNCLKNVPACHCRRYIAEGLAAVEAARGAK